MNALIIVNSITLSVRIRIESKFDSHLNWFFLPFVFFRLVFSSSCYWILFSFLLLLSCLVVSSHFSFHPNQWKLYTYNVIDIYFPFAIPNRFRCLFVFMCLFFVFFSTNQICINIWSFGCFFCLLMMPIESKSNRIKITQTRKRKRKQFYKITQNQHDSGAVWFVTNLFFSLPFNASLASSLTKIDVIHFEMLFILYPGLNWLKIE